MVQHLVHGWHSVQDLPQKMRQGTPGKHTLHIPNTALWSWLHSGILDRILSDTHVICRAPQVWFLCHKVWFIEQNSAATAFCCSWQTFEFATLGQQFGWIWQVCTSRNVLLDDAAHAFEQASLWVTLRKVKRLGHPIQKPAILHGNLVSYAIWSFNCA